MRIIDKVHGAYVSNRRVNLLSGLLSDQIPPGANVLDVGCGDGSLSKAILAHRPDIKMRGIDVLARPQTEIEVEEFDGEVIPYGDASFDVVMVVDVLHHAVDPFALLTEVVRTSRGLVLIKDHTMDGFLAGPTLRFMDQVGNARYGVSLPYNYWATRKWFNAFDRLNLAVSSWNGKLGLYGWPASWIFERSLHFVALLRHT